MLPFLDQFKMKEQLLLKTQAIDSELSEMADYPTKYLFFAICKTVEDVNLAMSYNEKGLNLVGLELVADTNAHDFFQRWFY